MSDGIAEAQDSQGRLFGFDRVHEMMSKRATAEEIAVAAQAFGQADDITVLQVQWLGQSTAVAFAPEPQLAAH
jgi:serine phosphatase RsbU (regulator of sigma subunit)